MVYSSISFKGQSALCQVINAITVDVEDWFHVCGINPEPRVPHDQWRVRRNTERIIGLLSEFGISATFFILGSVAAQEPELAPMIVAAGHEIASHGYSHRLTPQLGPLLFRDELRRTADLIERQSGERPVGFRAPRWSLSPFTPWAFDILAEEGYIYDSSCNPLPFVGNGRGPRQPYVIATPHGALPEFPPLVTPTPFCNLPTGGGWGFRLFPLALISAGIRGLNAEGSPAVLYLHPREMEAGGPRLDLSPLASFLAYGGRGEAGGRLRNLFGQFRFGTMRQLVDQWHSA